MAGDDLVYKLKQTPPKTWALVGVAAVLLVGLAWAYWPEGTPVIDPKTLAQQNDKDANPPVADVPPPTDGPRRKATKAK